MFVCAHAWMHAWMHTSLHGRTEHGMHECSGCYCTLRCDSSAIKVTPVGFEPTPFRNGALSHRLRPLGQSVSGKSIMLVGHVKRPGLFQPDPRRWRLRAQAFEISGYFQIFQNIRILFLFSKNWDPGVLSLHVPEVFAIGQLPWPLEKTWSFPQDLGKGLVFWKRPGLFQKTPKTHARDALH